MADYELVGLNESTPQLVAPTSSDTGTIINLTVTGTFTLGDASGGSFAVNSGAWTLNNNVTVAGTWADLGSVTTVDINGGTIDNAVIGGSTPAAITGTTIAGTDATDATSTTAAAMKTAGGLGVVKKIYAGDDIVLATAGKGVDFSANGGDTLAAYEEGGTWTPGLTFGGGSTGMTFATQTGRYQRVGNKWTCWGDMRLTNKGSSTGAAVITGLPATVANNAGSRTTALIRLNVVSFADYPQNRVLVNTTTIQLEEITNAGTVSNLDDTDFANNSNLIFWIEFES